VFKICVDIGGTFTDLILIDAEGKISEYKVPTVPHDYSQGVIDALTEAAAASNRPLKSFMQSIGLIVHGTTIATNALVTRSTARTAMLTTKGFRDIIEIRRALKIETRSMYEAFIPPYMPIIPRYLRFSLDEQTSYTGEVIKGLIEEELLEIVRRIKKGNVKALAICFINSYANPQNERHAARVCKRELKDVFITCSSEILPKMGEYERESTSVINACLGPIASEYLTGFEKKLKKAGFKGQLLIMQANQFTQSVAAIKSKPVYLLGSGPAAAPAGAASLGKLIRTSSVVTADMGGTTLDVALVNKGEVTLTAGKWFADDLVGIKVADVSSIGTGGGSIAWFDSLGLLRVGPQSAGADPGPACYGKGGVDPTVTDAALILGYIPADFFCGGKVPLDIALARKAVKRISDRLGTSIENAAQAIFTTINANMADEISRISTKMGYDIRDFSLLACGGGGPMCGAFWADSLGCQKLIIPNYASSFCAWSMFALEIGRDYLKSYIRQLNDARAAEINGLYEEMVSDAISEFKAFDVSRKDLVISRSLDLRYRGQYHEVEIVLPSTAVTKSVLLKLASRFHDMHKKLYTFTLPWVPIEIRNLRITAKIKGDKIKFAAIPCGTQDPSKAFKRERMCYFNGKPVETAVFDSTKLRGGNVVEGPAIIEIPTTTVVVPFNYQCRVDNYNNYIISRRS
jgi:N-methylhydantoinase A